VQRAVLHGGPKNDVGERTRSANER
jgi:hypothetical protein